MKKRILWISHLVPYPPKGGVLMRSYYLLRELAKHYEVDLFAINQQSLFRSFYSAKEQGLITVSDALGTFCSSVEIVDEPYASGQRSRYLLALRSLFSRWPYSIGWLYSTEIANRLDEKVQAGNYHAIHYDTITLAAYWRVENALPTILDHHNVESHMMLRRAKKEGNIFRKIYYYQEGWRLQRYETKMLRHFQLHIACSADDKARLEEIDKSISVEVVPNGVAVPEHIPKRQVGSEPRVLFIGGMTWYPNLDAMMYALKEIWPLVVHEIPAARLDVIGRSPSSDLTRIAAASHNVELHGFVDDIRPFYEKASVYLCPIRDGGGTKLKVLDALVHKVPLVAHPVACEGIELVNGMHARIADEAVGLARQVVDLLRDPEAGRPLAEAGYQLISDKYDVAKIGDHFAHQVDKAIGAY